MVQDSSTDFECLRAGDSNDADSGFARRSGDGGDGVVDHAQARLKREW